MTANQEKFPWGATDVILGENSFPPYLFRELWYLLSIWLYLDDLAISITRVTQAPRGEVTPGPQTELDFGGEKKCPYCASCKGKSVCPQLHFLSASIIPEYIASTQI